MGSSDLLARAAAGLPFEPYAVDRPIDEKGRYTHQLDEEFPGEIKLLCVGKEMPRRPPTWHTYLELFIPVAGAGRLRMGGTAVEIGAGDVTVVDHLKLHVVEDLGGLEL